MAPGVLSIGQRLALRLCAVRARCSTLCVAISKAAALPHFARGLPTVHTSRFSRPRRYQRSRSLVLSDLQARAVDQDRSHPPRTDYGSGHLLTLPRDLSSSSFYIPLRVSGDLCLHVATPRVQVCSTASPAILIVARIPSHDPNCAVSGIPSVVFIAKTPFNTQQTRTGSVQ